MGAALAEVSGLKLKAKFNKNIHVHTFGCPRIGNAALAQFFSLKVDTHYRVVHNRDLIPHLPPEPLEYHHSAFEVFWNEGFTEYKICNDSGEDRTCSNQYYPDYSGADHDTYFIYLGDLKC
ncbi:unnamed protein product [Sphagnum balticum]